MTKPPAEGTGRSRGFLPRSPREWRVIGGLAAFIAAAGAWSFARLPGESETGPQRAAGSTFDLTTCLVPEAEILSGGPGKDGIPALTLPPALPANDAEYLRPDDRVVGVRVGGAARAYPLRILVWHENVNDRVGGRDIAVTYCPLCDSVVVFDRRVGGKVREFGVSGLLYNSNVLLYDRQPDGAGESLWSQLQMRAVTGPAAAARLTLTALPAELTTWGAWRDKHPETTVLSAATGSGRRYDRTPYVAYFANDELMFPVAPAPSEAFGLKNKDKLIVVGAGQEIRAYPVRTIARLAGPDGSLDDTLGGRRIRLTYDRAADSVIAAAMDDKPAPLSVVYSFWFAWSAMVPDGDVFTGPKRGGPN